MLLQQIAKILGVEVTSFFQDAGEPPKMEERSTLYGFATKSDIEELYHIISQLKKEIASLKKNITNNAHTHKRKKA